MFGNVAVDLVVGDVLHTSHVLDLPGVQVDPLGSGVASQPQRVVGVGGAHAGNSNARLGEDLVDGKGDNILGLHGVDLVPFPVTELKLIVWSEGGSDGTSPIVHSELDGAVQHSEQEIVPLALDGSQDPCEVPGFAHHRDVKVQSNQEPSLGPDSASARTEEIPALHLVRAGNNQTVLGPPRTQGLQAGLAVLRMFLQERNLFWYK